jgi:hypothetical protein
VIDSAGNEVGPALFLPLDASVFNFYDFVNGFAPATLPSNLFGPMSHWAALKQVGGNLVCTSRAIHWLCLNRPQIIFQEH